jgi:hypothetical protein
VLDGIIQPLEWASSVRYDVSDVLGRAGTPQPAGSVFAYYLYDTRDSFAYFAVDCPACTARVNYDQYGLYLDEDHDGRWALDSSEGGYWVGYVGGDSVLYSYGGLVPRALSRSSLAGGRLQFETRIPLGDERWAITAGPGDTLGFFHFVAIEGGSRFLGWWPQSLLMSQWTNPSFYGLMLLQPAAPAISQAKPDRLPGARLSAPAVTSGPVLVRYTLPRAGRVQLRVHDAAGRLVRILADGRVAAGDHSQVWDLRDEHGHAVKTGAYLLCLTAEGRRARARLKVIR